MTETPIYDSGAVTVTTTRLVVGGRTYPIAGLTSVHVERRPRGNLAAVIGVAVAVVVSVAAPGWLAAAAGFGAAALAWQRLTRYAVCLNTAGRDVTAIELGDELAADEIAQAITDAIIARG